VQPLQDPHLRFNLQRHREHDAIRPRQMLLRVQAFDQILYCVSTVAAEMYCRYGSIHSGIFQGFSFGMIQ